MAFLVILEARRLSFLENCNRVLGRIYRLYSTIGMNCFTWEEIQETCGLDIFDRLFNKYTSIATGHGF